MSTYEPGQVCVATVRGVPNVRVLRTDHEDWRSAVSPEADGRHVWDDSDVTDVRPLVVLDWHPSPTHVVELLELLRDHYWTSLADQIEAQTRPPRIPEPGLWGVVEAGTQEDPQKRKAFVNYPDEGWCADSVSAYSWRNLVDPTLVRPGIEDES